MVKKHIKKGKSLTGKSGREAVKGASGIAAAYITRSKALKKLQITLKDFRRLCILKGIYPRDPKKKKEGKAKSYYHLKDIMYLQHEPLLQHFRDMKIFVRRFHRAKVMIDKFKMDKLKTDAPIFTLDHLIRERYPNFNIAINDLNEALNLLFLFNSLPQAVFRAFNEQHVQTVDQLLKEFLFYLAHTSSVTKMFISIKGIYVQAIINSISVTFIMPHKNPMYIPSDVDYRIMFTFLQFYEVLLKFTNFKLFHDATLAYPPVLDVSKNEKLNGFNSLVVSSLRNNEPVDASTDEFAAAAVTSADFNDPAADVDEVQADLEARRKVFKNCFFVLSREVNADLIALCIQSGGGEVRRHLDIADMSEEERSRVTHVVIDRPNTSSMAQFTNAHFVVPQWAIDSYNLRHRCPVSAYLPGQQPPPHLSPFIDDAAEGYMPKQREVLNAWKAGKTQEESEAEKQNGDKPAVPQESDEARYARELEQERQGIAYSTAKAAEDAEDDMEDSDDEDEDDAELDEESEDEEDVPSSRPAPAIMEEKDMPKIMMRNKDAKLYNAIQYGIKRKQKANESLLTKRKQIEEAETKSNKRAKKNVK